MSLSLVSNLAHMFTLETSLISSFIEAGVFPKPIAIELPSTQ